MVETMGLYKLIINLSESFNENLNRIANGQTSGQ